MEMLHVVMLLVRAPHCCAVSTQGQSSPHVSGQSPVVLRV